MTNDQNWQCPYCGRFQIHSHDSIQFGTTISTLGGIRIKINNFVKISEYGDIGLWVTSIACLNPQCKKLTLTVGLANVSRSEWTAN